MIKSRLIVGLILGTACFFWNCNSDNPEKSLDEKSSIGSSIQRFEWRVTRRLPFSEGYRLSRTEYRSARPENPEEKKPDPEQPAGPLDSTREAGQKLDVEGMYEIPSAFFSLKDPSLVYYQERWHLFCTRRGVRESQSIEYLRFSDWADEVPEIRKVLPFRGRGVRSPQIFRFRPAESWYLIFQKNSVNHSNSGQEAYFSTTPDILQPDSWSVAQKLDIPELEDAGDCSDFWVISDREKVFLYMTSKDGQLFYSHTSIEEFPGGWTSPELCLLGDFIEAGHIYWVEQWQQYLAVIVSSRYLKRYHKAYLSSTLPGEWKRLAVTRTRAFVSPSNVGFDAEPWADSFGHGEIIRINPDETMTIDITDCKVLLPIVRREDMNGKLYREIPWILTLLDLVNVRVEMDQKLGFPN